MNRKQFVILLGLVVMVGGAGLLVHQQNRRSWRSENAAIGQKLLPDFAVNQVAQIHIQSGAGGLHLARQNNLWRVTERSGYPADFAKISSLLLKLAGLKVVQSEQIGPSQLGRLELLPPGPETGGGTLVEFKNDSGKTLAMLLLGKPHLQKPPAGSPMGGDGWPDGRFVMAGTNSSDVAVINDPLEEVQPQPAQWLDKDFLSMEKPSSIAVRFPEATNSWELTRTAETNDWQLAGSQPTEKLDGSKISTLTSPFNSVHFSDVAPLPGNHPTNATLLTVKTFDGFTYVAAIGAKEDNDYPVAFQISATLPTERPAAKDEKPDEKARLDQAFTAEKIRLAGKLARESQFTNWVYRLPSYSLDEWLKKRAELLDAPKQDASSSTNASGSAEK